MTTSVSFREVSADRAGEFLAHGYEQRLFFPHRVYQLPKCGPDGFQLAGRMCGADDPAAMWELVLYAEPEARAGLPDSLFFDDDVVWHQQQFGRPGQVATASLVVDGPVVYALTFVSDLVQRIGRRREHKTRVEKRFAGWPHMLLNAVLSFADERGAAFVRVATSELAAAHTDRARQTDPTLFRRIYDSTVAARLPARRAGEWWEIELADVRGRIVAPARRTESQRATRTICICHDVERGRGHLDVDPAFAARAEEDSPRHLEAMRAIEAGARVRATYSVVGELLPDVRGALEADGHCLAFHSFDHRLDRDEQLRRCREVDYRLKGYRPPRSQMTPELSDANLLHHNFEWLAGSPRAVGATGPELRAGLVRLPIVLDDFPMHDAGMPYEDWERAALERIVGDDFAAIGLHDCYAPRWLEHYPGFLERVGELGELRTLDEVAAEVTLSSAA